MTRRHLPLEFTMNKRTLGYWSTTGLLALAMLGSGIGKLSQAEPVLASTEALGYPSFLLTILGFWTVAGAVALLAPGFDRVKEWAYAGIFFWLSGALASHILHGDPVAQSAPLFVLLGLGAGSYLLRPDESAQPSSVDLIAST